MRILLALALLLPTTLPAQDPADVVTFVNPSEEVEQTLERAFRTDYERTWCVTSYVERRTPTHTAFDVLKLVEIEGDRSRTTHAVPNCGADPTIHSHPRGTCQAAPDDQTIYLTSSAPFHGVLCGPRAIVWIPMRPVFALLHAKTIASLSP